MKILYVEDNQIDRDLTRRELKKSAPDFLMDTVATQRDALLALEKKSDYDLVLSDMRLPDGDGLAILTHIRGRGLPLAVVIITGQGDEETAVAALKAGAQDYAVKRDGYHGHLPLILKKALESYRAASIRSSQPLRILYAEPNASDADLTKRHLANFAPHISIEVVNDASKVFEIFSDQHNEHSYDAILLDYRLPGMNALEILKELRQATKTDLSIILVTGQGGEEVAVQALKLGATDYVVKNPGYLYKIPSVLENAVHSVQLLREHRTVNQLKRQNELILNSASEGIVGLDLASNHTFVNPAAARMLGYDIAEMIGLHSHSLWHHTKIDGSHYHEEACPIYEACLEGAALHDQEDLFWRKDRTSFPVEFSLMPICEGDRLQGSVLTFRDISERKRAEEALHSNKLQMSNALEIAHLGHWEYDIANDLFTFNDNFYKIFRTTVEKVGGYTMHSAEYAHRFVHPDDMNVVMEETRKAIETTDPHFNRQIEHRMLYADGTVGFLAVRFFIVKDSQCRTIKTYGVNQDITERKQAEEKLQQTLENLRKAFNATIQVMVSAVEARDPYTSGHQIRSTDIACAIAAEMKLSPDRIDGIRMAGSVHDIGKLSIPAEILSKPSKLSEIEFGLIKEHSRKGYEILKNVESPWPLAQIVYQHHERMNGSGYPRNLKGDEILMEARILAVADVVESMASHRPYRPALGIEAALKEIEKNKGTLYDDAVADACLRLFREKGYQFEGS